MRELAYMVGTDLEKFLLELIEHHPIAQDEYEDIKFVVQRKFGEGGVGRFEAMVKAGTIEVVD